jgi:hypothetical protein
VNLLYFEITTGQVTTGVQLRQHFAMMRKAVDEKLATLIWSIVNYD